MRALILSLSYWDFWATQAQHSTSFTWHPLTPNAPGTAAPPRGGGSSDSWRKRRCTDCPISLQRAEAEQEAEGVLWCRGHWGSTKGQNCSSEWFGSWQHPHREHQHPPHLLKTESTVGNIFLSSLANVNSTCSSAGLLCHIKAGKTAEPTKSFGHEPLC